MAKNAALFYDAAVATANQTESSAERNGPSIFQLAFRRIARIFDAQADREVEDFIKARGGVINDALDRELSRHFGRM